MNYLFLLCCLTLTLKLNAQRNGTLSLVAEFFRHGAREVVYDYWNSDKFHDWGALTSVGMRQHYVLGTTLRQRYIDDLQFLSPNYQASEIYIRSTDVNRTLRSALSQLYGFYPIKTGPYIPIDIPEELVNFFIINTKQNVSDYLHGIIKAKVLKIYNHLKLFLKSFNHLQYIPKT